METVTISLKSYETLRKFEIENIELNEKLKQLGSDTGIYLKDEIISDYLNGNKVNSKEVLSIRNINEDFISLSKQNRNLIAEMIKERELNEANIIQLKNYYNELTMLKNRNIFARILNK